MILKVYFDLDFHQRAKNPQKEKNLTGHCLIAMWDVLTRRMPHLLLHPILVLILQLFPWIHHLCSKCLSKIIHLKFFLLPFKLIFRNCYFYTFSILPQKELITPPFTLKICLFVILSLQIITKVANIWVLILYQNKWHVVLLFSSLQIWKSEA